MLKIEKKGGGGVQSKDSLSMVYHNFFVYVHISFNASNFGNKE